MESLLIVMPIFMLAALGYVLRRAGIIRAAWVDVLNSYVYYIALPALVIHSQFSLHLFDPAVLQVVGLSWGVIAVASLVCAVAIRLLPLSNRLRQAVYVAATVGNSVYLGIPIVTRAFEHAPGVESSTLVLIGIMQLLAGITCALIGIEFMTSRSVDLRRVVHQLAINPLLLSLIAGVIFSLLPRIGLIDDMVKPPLSMIAGTASPIALITLGAFLHSRHPRQNVWALGYVTIYKLLVLPLITGLIVGMSSLGAGLSHAVILYSGMPVAVTAFVVSQKYKLDAAFVAVAMLVTTVVSGVTLTILLAMR